MATIGRLGSKVNVLVVQMYNVICEQSKPLIIAHRSLLKGNDSDKRQGD